MGFSVCVSGINTMFKSLVATCLVAAARAQLVAHVPFGSSTGLDPITQGLDASTQGLFPYAHHPYAFGHYYGKRSADADAYYAHGYGLAPYAHHAVAYGVPFGSSTGLDPITQGLDASTQGLAPYAYHGYHYYGK